MSAHTELKFTSLRSIAGMLGIPGSARRLNLLLEELRAEGVVVLRIGGEYQVEDHTFAAFIDKRVSDTCTVAERERLTIIRAGFPK
ncbi:MAG: hypothetical protein K2Q32_01505 [Alphaproteobacteria bacterium]|nr:hypothetical protein [Alphaproteobacteria bacterium]